MSMAARRGDLRAATFTPFIATDPAVVTPRRGRWWVTASAVAIC